MNSFKKLLSLKAEYDKMIKEQGSEIVKELVKEFFAKTEGKVVSVRWEQYTPYFNDGDACSFRIGEQRFLMLDDDTPDAQANDYGDEANYIDSWQMKADEKWHPERKVYPEALIKACEEISSQFYRLKDVLESVFGDHVQVTVNANEITTKEYSHD